ncbi:hypothetical protein BC830DRAFT_1063832 [Chytriomyces sp. MP71]|nr:hypothetical protein BC830DRAFT_1063832 [Chytriomyces sp. MP71]
MPNTSVCFKAIPNGPATDDTFEVKHDVAFTVETAEVQAQHVLVKLQWISLDPYMRGRMRSAEVKSYSAPFAIGQPMVGHALGEVVKSASDKYKVGDVVLGFFKWQQYAMVHEAAITRVLNAPGAPALTPETYLGLLGMPSFTAYVGLVAIGKPKEGETLFVSAAAGAVGQVVGQIGKRLGLRVVGSAGTDDKVDYLISKLGFDAAFNYNKHNILEKLTELCPNGIDIYFENVGGETLEAAITLANNHARFPVCGMISQYHGANYHVKNLMQIIQKRILIQGFLQSDWLPTHGNEFMEWMFAHALDGKFVYESTIAEGIESIPRAFIGMMEGKNTGKQLVKFF